jgi:hypothetical protein
MVLLAENFKLGGNKAEFPIQINFTVDT